MDIRVQVQHPIWEVARDALRNFYTQMIVGDSADNILVCSGKGKVYAGKLFS